MRDTSADFHAANEASDLHRDKGFHRHFHGTTFENGNLIETTCPDLPAQVDALNDWFEPGEQQDGDGFQQAGEVLKRLLCWIVQADSKTPRHLSSIARRAVCLSFVVCSDRIPWQSLQSAADEFRCTKQSLGKYSREILELANGRFQRSGMFRSAESRERRAEVSRRQWDVRGRLSPEEKNRKRRRVRQPRLAARRAAYAARKAKLSRKNTLQASKVPDSQIC